MLYTPLLLIIYNRPDKVKSLISSLSKIKPKNIYVFCDGPKNEQDKKKVEQSQNLISSINWTKTINTNFLRENIGCKNGVNSALDWFFNNVNKGIILEDDCIPNQSFFQFSHELLNKYKEDKRISLITGFNRGDKLENYNYDYYFSSYGGVWGWATWNDRWLEYRKSDLKKLLSDNRIIQSLDKKGISKSFLNNVRKSLAGGLDTWDYMWSFYNMTQNKLTIVPQKNFIINIGFGKDATHTKFKNKLGKIKQETLNKRINHPIYVLPDFSIDLKRKLSHNKIYQLINVIKSII